MAAAPSVDLDELSLKRLLDIDVTSVSKRSQRLQDVASSIYVITEEDIRRSGATRIQDVLKMAVDNLFKSMLLLNKKKYAALKFQKVFTLKPGDTAPALPVRVPAVR